MTDATAQTGVRRVLAAYDAMTSDDASLIALTEMTAQLQAELELLFVEDIDLVRVAGLPPARQINLRTGAAGPLALDDLEAEMRAAGARLRRRLADAATRRHIRWSFRTVRGEAAEEVLLASEAADLLVLRHRRSWVRPPSGKPGLTAVARQVRRSVLLLEHGAEAPRATVVLFRPGEQGRRALALAVRLAAAGHGSLDILVAGPDQVQAAKEQVADRPGPDRPLIRYRISGSTEDDVVSDTVALARKRLLVLGADDPVLQGTESWIRLIDDAGAVLLVR